MWLEMLLAREQWPRDKEGYLDVIPVASEKTGTAVSTAMRRCLAVASRENGLRRCVQTAKDGNTFRVCWGGLITDRVTPIRRVVWLYRPSDADAFTDLMKVGAMRMAKRLGIGIAFVECCLEKRNVRGLLDKCLQFVSHAGSAEDCRNSTAVVWDREGEPETDLQAALSELHGFRTVTVGPPSAMVRRDHFAVGTVLAEHILASGKFWPSVEGKNQRVFVIRRHADCLGQYADVVGGLRHVLNAANRGLPIWKHEIVELSWYGCKSSEYVDNWRRVGLKEGDHVVALDIKVDWRFCCERLPEPILTGRLG
jgi:hypothetical protein